MIVRCTYSIPEEVEELLTEIYIKRLKKHHDHRHTRSSIVAEAINLLFEKEKNEVREMQDK